ncbi:General transcription factor 3C polypeptide 6 [Balamuthia mandrillaris]
MTTAKRKSAAVAEAMEEEEEEEEEVEEEEFYVTLELEDFLDTNLLQSCQRYKLLGLNTEGPLLQVDDMFFQGTYAETVGTHLYFADPTSTSSSSSSSTSTAPLYTATKKLIFRRVGLEPKPTPSSSSSSNKQQQQEEEDEEKHHQG